MLEDYEEEQLEVLLNAFDESSGDVWEAFVNAPPQVLMSYLVARFGAEKVKELSVNLPD
ncbi:hypothetical protein VCHA53O466_40172 [Vibrio chagasii]|nr:hypothetical protein VCHA53O466_40172 [Vibrio chagasii]